MGSPSPIPPNAGVIYWKEKLKQSKYVVAPMVDQSELAWRLMCRNHGAQLCYTPMFHASNFVRDPVYRRDNFETSPEDRPLIVQFCANSADVLVKACQLVAPHCDGVDLNLGCPQTIAKRGHYGAFLQDEWELIAELVRAVHENVSVPISCKVRIFEDIEKTVRYAKMLEEAGCQLLTVHGRTREQKGRTTGIASWSHIAAVKKAVNIPVFANGNIQYHNDVKRCLDETGVDGVMSAEGILHNPFLFEEARNHPPACWEPALEYLKFARTYRCPMSFMRGHLFKLFHYSFLKYNDLRDMLAAADDIDGLEAVAVELKNRCEKEHNEYLAGDYSSANLPHWICQPYVRPSTADSSDPPASTTDHMTLTVTDLNKDHTLAVKRRQQDEIDKLAEEFGLSKKKAKKMIKHPERPLRDKPRRIYVICPCGNPLSPKCTFKLCKTCCRVKLREENALCDVHRLHVGVIS